jgi:hypothetical protein
MPLANTLPFGLRDVKLFSLDASGERVVPGEDLPVSRTFSFKEVVESEQLEGDDQVQGSHEYNPMVEWELESGGISFEAYKILAGGTVTTSGVAPAQVKTYSKDKSQSRPYFEVEGQAISDSGGDMHAVVYRCKADGDLEGGFENGSFMLMKAAGKGYGQLGDSGKLYDFIQNETVAAIVNA